MMRVGNQAPLELVDLVKRRDLAGARRTRVPRHVTSCLVLDSLIRQMRLEPSQRHPAVRCSHTASITAAASHFGESLMGEAKPIPPHVAAYAAGLYHAGVGTWADVAAAVEGSGLGSFRYDRLARAATAWAYLALEPGVRASLRKAKLARARDWADPEPRRGGRRRG
jgi:hypothetical protein